MPVPSDTRCPVNPALWNRALPVCLLWGRASPSPHSARRQGLQGCLHTQVHAALFTAARKQPRCPAAAGRPDKQTGPSSPGCDWALRRKAVLTPASAWASLQDTVLRERSRAQKGRGCTFHTREVPRGSESQRQRVGERSRRAGGQGGRGVSASQGQSLFAKARKLWRRTEVVRLCGGMYFVPLNRTRGNECKRVSFMLGVLSYNFVWAMKSSANG